jgi:hypothetical protein
VSVASRGKPLPAIVIVWRLVVVVNDTGEMLLMDGDAESVVMPSALSPIPLVHDAKNTAPSVIQGRFMATQMHRVRLYLNALNPVTA